ncbi:DEAD/DEAH box helicase-domain-containing protein [Aspergillus terreus]|uniref:DEAD/DEAH box helicase-domain-containing protein n=1 Tax=Aspergillus terreus TaxID=33178 RepID=A0A5M3ZBU4_ASPTE|nr:hypothetical protein ATETN484_0013042900 [Aspergillus terreus]GFF20659.1 DEAD/DEAH box helicase-domain-containing protein [Aspergillus terreus]
MDFAQQAPLPVIATASSEPPVTANSPPTRPRKRSLSVSSDLDNPGERPAAKRRTTRYQIAIAVCIPSRPRTPGRSRPIVAGRTVEPSLEPYAPPSTPTLARSLSAIDLRSPPYGPSARRFPRQSHFKANHSDNEEDEAEKDLPPPIIESTPYAPSTDGRRQPVLPSLPSAGQRWLDEILFGFCVSLAFTAVLGIQASTLTLKEPYSYSTLLSALIWVSRVLLLEYALPLRRYRYLPDVRPRHEVRNHLYPLHAVLELLGRAQWHIRHTARPGNTLWSPDYQTLFYRGSPQGIHLDDLRRWIQALLQSVTQTLEHDFLLGILPSIDLTTLVDDLSERRAGFYFLDLPANLLQPTYAPLLAAQASPLPGIVPLRRRDRWDRRTVIAYRAYAQRFLDRLALLIQLTWGQPSREPELLPLRWRNTAAAPRNLYLRESTVLFITEYRKSQARTQTTQHVARFLPPAVSRLIVLYLLRVRPFLELLHQQLRPDGQPRLSPSRVPPSPRDDELFALPGAKSRRARAGTITALMRQTAQPFLQGQDIPTYHYRHIAIAVAKKHLASQATPADWGTAAAAMGNILAAQAGHHGRINKQVYAVEAGQPFGLLPGRIEQFAVASQLWHSLLLRPTLPEGRSGCESESLLLDLSRSSQPTQKPRIRSDPRPHAVRSLPWPFLYLDPEWQLLVCIQCQTALYHT